MTYLEFHLSFLWVDCVENKVQSTIPEKIKISLERLNFQETINSSCVSFALAVTNIYPGLRNWSNGSNPQNVLPDIWAPSAFEQDSFPLWNYPAIKALTWHPYLSGWVIQILSILAQQQTIGTHSNLNGTFILISATVHICKAPWLYLTQLWRFHSDRICPQI